MKNTSEMGEVDEKILFDSCGGIWSGPTIVEGKAVLFETSKIGRSAAESPR
jgi:hypothetical protein